MLQLVRCTQYMRLCQTMVAVSFQKESDRARDDRVFPSVDALKGAIRD